MFVLNGISSAPRNKLYDKMIYYRRKTALGPSDLKSFIHVIITLLPCFINALIFSSMISTVDIPDTSLTRSLTMSGRQVQPFSRLPVPAPVPPILSPLRHSSFPQPRDGCLPEMCAHKKQPVSRVISPRYRLPSIRISQVFSD